MIGGTRIFRIRLEFWWLVNIVYCRDTDDMATIRLSISQTPLSLDNGRAWKAWWV
jgi:hypothetical protein